MNKRQRKKERLKSFSLEEIASVTVPAQAPALAAITKSDSIGDVSSSIQYTYTPTTTGGPTGTFVTDGTGQPVQPLFPQPVITWPVLAQPIVKVDPSTDPNKESTMSDDNKDTKELDAAVAKSTELEAKLLRSDAVLDLSPEHRAHFDTLTKAEDQDAFLDLSEDARTTSLTKVDDGVVFTAANGDEYFKSDDPRMVKMAQERDADRKELAKARATAAQLSYEQRADTELKGLSGDLAVRSAIVKALDTIENEDVRKAAFESIKGGSQSLEKAFDEIGHGDGTVTKTSEDAQSKLTKLANDKASKDAIDFYDAYAQVELANPELRAQAN